MKILIINKDHAVCGVIQETLRKAHPEDVVELVWSSSEAALLIMTSQEQPYDLVILEKKIGSVDTCKHIISLIRQYMVCKILLTSTGLDKIESLRNENYDIDDMVNLPWKPPEKFLDIVSEVLGR